MKRPARAIASVLLSGVLALPASAALAQKAGGVLRSYLRDSPPSASIHEEATSATVVPFMSVYNNLVVFDQHVPRNNAANIVPELATAWRWDDSNTKLTFTLREGVTWHDGKPFTSADVKCTWDTLLDKRDSGWRKNPRKEWYFNLKEVTVNGDFEVSFQLARPQPALLMMLAGGFSPVYSCHVNGREMRSKPIGTGPFKVAEFKPNDSVKLVRNTEYWKPGRPYLDGIEYKVIANRSTRTLAFIAGEFDLTFAQDISIPLLKDIRGQAPNAYCEVNPSNSQAQLLVNSEAPPFDDAKIRRAMMLTIDRKAFIDIISEGTDSIGGSMLPPPEGSWGLTPQQLADVPGYGTDIEKSREEGRRIMRELGYGPDKPLKIKVGSRNLAIYRDPAVILIDQLKQVHIDGELEVLETSVWYARLARKNFHVGMNVNGIGIDDPDVVLYEGYACGSERNYSNYCNRELQVKFDEQSAMIDSEKRKALVHQIDRKLQEDAARVVIYHTRSATCWQPAVKNITLGQNSVYNHWRFEDVWLDR